jgi:hypothetical protein
LGVGREDGSEPDADDWVLVDEQHACRTEPNRSAGTGMGSRSAAQAAGSVSAHGSLAPLVVF